MVEPEALAVASTNEFVSEDNEVDEAEDARRDDRANNSRGQF